MHKTLILIVEDEDNICSFIETTLKANNYSVITAKKASDALSMASSYTPDLMLLDLGLPDMDGIEVLRQVRSWSVMPVIIVSARSDEAEKVQTLDLGADDYITKPFGTSELLARIRTALRHSIRVATEEAVFRVRGLSVDFAKRQVLLNGAEVHLTQIEYKIVSLLVKHAGRVLTYDQMIAELWGPYAEKDNKILRVNMANIRRKIEKNPAAPQYIFTEVGVGYRLAEE